MTHTYTLPAQMPVGSADGTILGPTVSCSLLALAILMDSRICAGFAARMIRASGQQTNSVKL